MPNVNMPEFVQGDTARPLDYVFRDPATNTPIDITTGTVTLFAEGIDSGDKPGGAPGVAGTKPGGGASGLARWVGIPALCTVTGRKSDIYKYRARFVNGPTVVWSPEEGHFLCYRAPV